MHTRRVRGRGRVKIGPPLANFKRLFNKNAIKPKIGGPLAFFPESLDPPRDVAKNLSYPLPWIFNPCALAFIQWELLEF
jgi:hypothetical protein